LAGDDRKVCAPTGTTAKPALWPGWTGSPRFAAGVGASAVVADGRCGIERFLDIARFQPAVALLGMVGPDAGIAVGLKFLSYEQAAVALQIAAAPPHIADASGRVRQRLDVVADFVGDDVGFGEITASAEPGFHLPEEAQIHVDLAITGQ
jgi:hypothetical protein